MRKSNWPFYECYEMLELRKELDALGIQWIDDSDVYETWWICRTKFYIGTTQWSVIHGMHTYGGVDFRGVDNGLLELMTSDYNNGDPVGFLTAAEIVDRIKDHMKLEDMSMAAAQAIERLSDIMAAFCDVCECASESDCDTCLYLEDINKASDALRKAGQVE